MHLFRHYYIVSTTILCGCLILSAFSSIISGQFLVGYLIVAFLIGAVPLVPIFRTGGINENPRWAISIAATIAVAFSLWLVFAFIYFVRTAGAEGPEGEGAPGAFILAMVFFAMLFVCPWLLTALRGLRLWNHRIQAEQDLRAALRPDR